MDSARGRPKLAEVVRQRIRSLRIEQGLTQEALCERAGISVDAVTRIEGGSRAPTLDTIERLAGALRCSPSVLIGGAEPPKSELPVALRRIVAVLEREAPTTIEAAELAVRAFVRAVRGAATPPARKARGHR